MALGCSIAGNQSRQGRGRDPRNSGSADGDIIIVQDADWEYDPREIASVIQPILDDKADVVYGSRFRQTSPQIHRDAIIIS